MRAAGGRYDPVPVDQAIAYIIEILPAFGYLHDLGLLYCDFKPDNIIQVGDAVKLIDLGGVRRIGDLDSAIYGTVGYQAPEVPDVGPSVASRHLHDRPHAGRAGRWSSAATSPRTSPRCRRSPTCRCSPRHDSLLPAARQGVRGRPGRPVPVRRRDARAAARRPARDRRRGQARSGCRAALGAVRALRGAGRLRGRARPGASCRRCSSTPATGWRRGSRRCPSPSRGHASRRCTTRRRRPSRCTSRRPGPPSTRGVRRRRERRRARSSPTTRGSGGRCGSRAWRPWPKNDAAAARSAFNAVYGQVPGELAPKLALALACELQRGVRRRRVALRHVRADRRELHRARPRSGWPGSGGPAATWTARSPRSTSCRRPAGPTSRPAASGPACSPRPAAACRAWRPRWTSIERVTIDPLDRARAHRERPRRGARTGAHRRAGREAADRRPDRDRAATCATASRRPTVELAQMTDDGEERMRLVDQANRVRPWTLR